MTATTKADVRRQILDKLGMRRLPAGTRIEKLNGNPRGNPIDVPALEKEIRHSPYKVVHWRLRIGDPSGAGPQEWSVLVRATGQVVKDRLTYVDALRLAVSLARDSADVTGNPQLIDKHRPEKLEDLVGAEEIVTYIKAKQRDPDYDRDRLLFTGPGGTGKTSAAQIIARMFAQHPDDVHEVQPGATNEANVALAREIQRDAQFLPRGVGGWTVWIVNEAQILSRAAKNVFLDLLENVGPNRMFILTSTEPEAFDLIFRSRMQHFEFDALTEAELVPLIRRIARKERSPVDAKTARRIAGASEGNARKAVGVLERFLTTGALPPLPEGASPAPVARRPRRQPTRKSPIPRAAAGRASRGTKKVAAKRPRPKAKAKWRRQAVFFDPKKFTPATARAWLKGKGTPVRKGKKLQHKTFAGVGRWFGWDLVRVSKKKAGRLRWQPFGQHIRARLIAPGIRAPAKKKRSILADTKGLGVGVRAQEARRLEALRRRSKKKTIRAELQKTAKGWRVILSLGGEPLSGTFRGPGGHARAVAKLEAIRKRTQINPRQNRRNQIAAGTRRRKEFLKFGIEDPEVELENRFIRSRTIPDGMMLIGGYAQLNYISDKDGKGYAEYYHRPPQVGKAGALARGANSGRRSERVGGDALFHPSGDYVLVLPPAGQKFRMTRDGLIN